MSNRKKGLVDVVMLNWELWFKCLICGAYIDVDGGYDTGTRRICKPFCQLTLEGRYLNE
jgi:hypothetical protein